ncbi:uncharacterized protein BX664DRAFT_131213 [Halteromyces radiatus]|uniref:uncharacterized protein n=1 Tax=Halteromyces radiatus TaxID=101107 RepID=UPI002220A8B6|nr:uncharacterized protein BX664DRAFT_131213 [Halteromyces radiatus]KAI8089299.1 hypothetical protein BX664DRAFT_131213 [Halteromyces radiatus]
MTKESLQLFFFSFSLQVTSSSSSSVPAVSSRESVISPPSYSFLPSSCPIGCSDSIGCSYLRRFSFHLFIRQHIRSGYFFSHFICPWC